MSARAGALAPTAAAATRERKEAWASGTLATFSPEPSRERDSLLVRVTGRYPETRTDTRHSQRQKALEAKGKPILPDSQVSGPAAASWVCKSGMEMYMGRCKTKVLSFLHRVRSTFSWVIPETVIIARGT